MSNNHPTTRAQWVVPKQKVVPSKENLRGVKKNSTASNIFRQPYHDFDGQASSSSVIIANTYTSDPNLNHQRLTQSEHVDHGDQQHRNEVDDAICRTICVIVEQYLKELREHQSQINLARSRLVRASHNHHHHQHQLSTSDDCTFIAYNDLSRLHVRDEQTKAIETIKQLTSYLKELSTIRRHEGIERADPVSEEIHDKLSDLRNDIIHTLNDFVLANSDIDVPIVGLDEQTSVGRDYDLCIEAQRSNRDNICQIEISNRPGDPYAPPSSSSRAQGSSSENTFGSNNNNQQAKKGAAKPHEQQQQQQPPTTIRRPFAIHSASNVAASDPAPDEQSAETKGLEACDDKYKLMTLQDDSQLIELDKRRREIHKLEKDTVELRNLFADFYQLVKMQGEQVDNIEDNLVIAAQQISEGRNHLQQRHLKGLTVLIPMTGCITGALIGGPIGFLLGGKLGGMTIICASSLLGLLSSLGAQKCIETNQQKTR